MFNSLKKVIISGANGFLGSNLLNDYVSNGVFVYAIVRDIKKVDNLINDETKVKYIELDIKNIKELPRLISDLDIDVFFHFSWDGSSGVLRGNYNSQIDNIKYTCDSLIAAKLLNCKRFVFAESIMEYEIQKALKNNGIISINTLYSTAKLCAKYMAKAIAYNESIEYVGALISNVFGKGEKSERLINSTIRKLIKKEHCSFSSGEQLYDFIYISDAIEAIKLVASYGKSNESYYIGNRKQHKLKFFLSILGNIVDNKAKLGFGEYPDPLTVINYNEFNTNKIYDEFNFKPKITFEDGIKMTYNGILEEK